MKCVKFSLFFSLFIIYSKVSIILAEDPQAGDFNCPMYSKPKQDTECNRFNGKNYYCCFLTPVEANTTNLCYPYEINSYTGQGTINYAQITYNIKCGLGSENFSFESSGVKMCGVLNPADEEKCFVFSTSTNSCCYFKHNEITGCYFVGAKFFGRTIIDDLLLSCQGEWITYRYYQFLFLIIIFLFII